MSWLEFHRESERLAVEAGLLRQRGQTSTAREFYEKAAHAEERALDALEFGKERTFGITAVSAVSLYFKAELLECAERIAHRELAGARLPKFAIEQLRALLHSMWSEEIRRDARVGFVRGEVIVSVKGGEVVEGGAPLDLIIEKVQNVQSLFYRTFEFIRQMPHRKRGAPKPEIVESCRPWLFQTAPGSYQFSVAVQDQKQGELFDHDSVRPQDVADSFLSILRASVVAPLEELPKLVPDAEYRNTFLKLTRNLAPSGSTFSQLDIRTSTDTQPLSLVANTRTVVNEALRASRRATEILTVEEESIVGVLRGVQLDDDWLEVVTAAGPVKIRGVEETVDDVIGPMLNRTVTVYVTKERNKFRFRDIERIDEPSLSVV